MRFLLPSLGFAVVIAGTSCSREATALVKSAQMADFQGKWKGFWNWHPEQGASLEIANGSVRVVDFPIRNGAGVDIVSGEGKASFENAYGAKGAPCVLLTFPQTKVVSAVFISPDRARLVYPVSTAKDWYIVFDRIK